MARFHAIFAGISVVGALVVNDLQTDVVNVADVNEHLKNGHQVITTQAMESLQAAVDMLFDPETSNSVHLGTVVNAASRAMDLDTASKVIDETALGKDVYKLVQSVNDGNVATGFSSQFDEDSLAKARIALNELVEKAWIELDDKIFKCKGFQDMNRENYAQTNRDIARLIEQINDLSRVESESVEGVATKEQEIIDQQALLKKETKLYNIEYAENKAELTIRQNDLDVFQFILVFTKCADATSFAQETAKVCETKSGRKTLVFHNSSTAAHYKSLLTVTSKRSVDTLLRGVEHASFLQRNLTTPPPSAVAPVPVKGADAVAACGGQGGMGDEDECMKSCSPNPPDCGLLHDKLSLMWGEFKDKVDELTMEMARNLHDFTGVKANLNNQISLLVKSKGRFSQLLAESRANLAADRAELKMQYQKKAKLDKQYVKYMTACKKRIQWIMYQDMCAIKVVRNAVLENSTVCPSATIQDCDMDSWVAESCSVSCDDTCNPNQPFKCGGWQKMTRKTVVQNDDCGIKCPTSEKFKRCGQYPCPIDCDMSSWSGWSKCTAECEGGLQSHTRSILVKPKNGGSQCDTVEEARPCNTMSCDRDCSLNAWTAWTPCSVACSGGFQEAFRHVLVPTRGDGKCPKPESAMRYEKQECNTQKCVGDEICVANQDLIIAIDGSGSVQAPGFEKLKKFVTTLLSRYKTTYYGSQVVKVGIVLFGNGVIMPDGKTVSPAINAQKMSSDMAEVSAAVEGLPFKKGFTNMAQAFSMAEDMFVKGSRKGAQQAVMVVTDGKPSFSFMTNEMVEQLDDKAIMRFFVVISEDGPQSDVMNKMKGWASQPWETNLVHVPGLEVLEADVDLWAMKSLVKFCPLAESPTIQLSQEKMFGYQLVKKGGWCGGDIDKKKVLSETVESPEACYTYVKSFMETDPDAANTFVVGVGLRDGWCVLGNMKTSADEYSAWITNKEEPACASGWKSSMLYDFYAVAPPAKL